MSFWNTVFTVGSQVTLDGASSHESHFRDVVSWHVAPLSNFLFLSCSKYNIWLNSFKRCFVATRKCVVNSGNPVLLFSSRLNVLNVLTKCLAAAIVPSLDYIPRSCLFSSSFFFTPKETTSHFSPLQSAAERSMLNQYKEAYGALLLRVPLIFTAAHILLCTPRPSQLPPSSVQSTHWLLRKQSDDVSIYCCKRLHIEWKSRTR